MCRDVLMGSIIASPDVFLVEGKEMLVRIEVCLSL